MPLFSGRGRRSGQYVEDGERIANFDDSHFEAFRPINSRNRTVVASVIRQTSFGTDFSCSRKWQVTY